MQDNGTVALDNNENRVNLLMSSNAPQLERTAPGDISSAGVYGELPTNIFRSSGAYLHGAKTNTTTTSAQQTKNDVCKMQHKFAACAA